MALLTDYTIIRRISIEWESIKENSDLGVFSYCPGHYLHNYREFRRMWIGRRKIIGSS